MLLIVPCVRLTCFIDRYHVVRIEQSNFHFWEMNLKFLKILIFLLADKKKRPQKITEEVKKDLDKRLKDALDKDKSHTKKLRS